MRAQKRAGILGVLLPLCLAVPAVAQQDPLRPSLNFYGGTGLIDMPSGESQPDGQISTTVSHFAGITRVALTFQMTPRLSGSFRYAGLQNLNFEGYETYFDRSFDIRYQFLDEGRYLPSMVIGLQDFVGTGIYSGEFIAATKTLTPRLKATVGLGWGRLGSYGEIGSPFGDRPRINVGLGGEPNWDQWFRGPAAPFFGIEWRPTDKLGVKVEYSSDAYRLEARRRNIVERDSPWNVGIEYQVADAVRLGAYAMHGSQFGINAQISLNPKTPPNHSGYEPGGLPIDPRPSRTSDPDAWSTDWTAQADAPAILKSNAATLLGPEGIELIALEFTATSVRATIRNNRYDAPAQAIGRTARVLARVMPASVERFTIVPMVPGSLPASATTVLRSDLERFEHAGAGTEALLARTEFAPAGARPPAAALAETAYPRLSWALGPYTRTEYFDPDNPFRIDFGAELRGRYEPVPGLVFAGSLRRQLGGYLAASKRPSNSVLPRVRSNYVRYNRAEEDRFFIDHLTAAYYMPLRPDLYGRVTAGYLERMFAGVSAEALWKPVNRRWALGAELNYVRQREFEQGFGLRDYDVVTGHASLYYDFGSGYHAQVDAGRYLAGDWGATLTLDREFDNGFRLGAFATLTDVSFEDFGEGSFDKGIRISIPLSWFTGQPHRGKFGTTIRPVTRDGGARLHVNDRLYSHVREYDRDGLVSEWGRVWR